MSPDEKREFDRMKRELAEIRGAFYANNFSTSQDFFKYVRFNGRLKVPHLDTLPTTCEVGEIFEYSGKVYVCSAADTPTVVGTQT